MSEGRTPAAGASTGGRFVRDRAGTVPAGARPGSFAHEWLELVERSGLLVSEPVLHQAFPDGPEAVSSRAVRALLGAWQRFLVDPADPERLSGWLGAVLRDFLGWTDALRLGAAVPDACAVDLPELGATLRPHGARLDAGGRPELLVWRAPAAQGLDRVERGQGVWRATPAAKLERLQRDTGIAFGLLTNGHQFRLCHVPAGLPASWVEFPAALFFEEQAVLRGFATLLGGARFDGPEPRRLRSLTAASERTQAELTDGLGEQVRSAVEQLLLALDAADRAAAGHPLAALGADELYRAAVYAVMRLVFILFAEERSLLPHGNVFFDEGYGLGRLLHQLEEERRSRPESFDREADAWPRLLALFRLVFHGSGHPDLPLPVYGGDLFAPSGFPALAALEHPALRIPNRAVHRILRALTFGEARVGRERLAHRYSYRNLDVEHIGYLYEGLLDHRAARAPSEPPEPLVKLANGSEEALPLAELERQAVGGPDALIAWLAGHKVLGGNAERIRARLEMPPADALADLAALPPPVANRCRPFAGVVQTAEVVVPGHLYLTTSTSRRASGTHYTPIVYTRAMVAETLDPLVYVGENGRLAEPRRLRPPRELLALRVCDPAMGSGAFLVQVIRYLGARLVDAWEAERERHDRSDRAGRDVAPATAETDPGPRAGATPLYLPFAEPAPARADRIPVPAEREEAEAWARRLVAERCIYGVDRNPLAAEMAKLSLWLVTLAKDKPFTFVDHALRAGDSLVGLASLAQLQAFRLDAQGRPKQAELLASAVGERVAAAAQHRTALAAQTVVTPDDVAQKEALLAAAETETRSLEALADLLLASVLVSTKPADQERTRLALLAEATHALDDPAALEALAADALGSLRPLHWPLAFPEVFERDNGGFDAFVGNPPYQGGQKLTGLLGQPYREYLVHHLAEGARGSADLVAYFFLRCFRLLRDGGNFGLLAVNTIAEGDTRQVGLEAMLRRGATIYSAHPNEPWPNQAAVVTSRVHVHRGRWGGTHAILGRPAPTISAFLTDRAEWTPKRLKANEGIAFQGSIVLGMGFVLTEAEAQRLLDRDPRNADVLFPYLNGKELNAHPDRRPRRWVINFWDWPEQRARTYPEVFRIVEEKVKTERLLNNRKVYRDSWWHFAEKRPALYHAIGRGSLFEHHPGDWKGDSRTPVAGKALSGKHGVFPLLGECSIFDQTIIVFACRPEVLHPILHSPIFTCWWLKQGGKIKVDPRFNIDDCFLSFPFPEHWPQALDSLSHALEAALRDGYQAGLDATEIYNRVHQENDRSPAAEAIRHALARIDRELLAAYGWLDLDVDHGFHGNPSLPANDRVRFGPSAAVREAVIRRLDELNRERYAEEVAQGLHDERRATNRPARTSSSSRRATPMPTPKPAAPPPPPLPFRTPLQTSLPLAPAGPLSEVAEPAARYGDAPPTAVTSPPSALSADAATLHRWLTTHPDWHARADLLAAVGLSEARWLAVVEELLAAGLVERAGGKRGTRYRVVGSIATSGTTGAPGPG